MSAISRRKLITTGLAAAAGFPDWPRQASPSPPWIDPARSRRSLWSGRDADLRRAAAAH